GGESSDPDLHKPPIPSHYIQNIISQYISFDSVPPTPKKIEGRVQTQTFLTLCKTYQTLCKTFQTLCKTFQALCKTFQTLCKTFQSRLYARLSRLYARLS
ncbi:unnamed protein product, partial [Owenia fusiformis]